MKIATIFRNWWVILIKGILMIVLSIVIFDNPDVVLITIAFWFGIVVLAASLLGIITYFSNAPANRDPFSLLGSIVLLVFGLLMISKTLITMKAITVVFGIVAALFGLDLLRGSWKGRKQWSLWWIIALLGVGALIAGVKSIFNIYAGAATISNLIGISILISGIGLVCLAFLKKKIIMVT